MINAIFIIDTLEYIAYIIAAIYGCLMKPYVTCCNSPSEFLDMVVGYDVSTIVCTSSNDTLSIYITHLRLVNDNYCVRRSGKGNRHCISEIVPDSVDVSHLFPRSATIIRGDIAFFQGGRYQGKPASLSQCPLKIASRGGFVEIESQLRKSRSSAQSRIFSLA